MRDRVVWAPSAAPALIDAVPGEPSAPVGAPVMFELPALREPLYQGDTMIVHDGFNKPYRATVVGLGQALGDGVRVELRVVGDVDY